LASDSIVHQPCWQTVSLRDAILLDRHGALMLSSVQRRPEYLPSAEDVGGGDVFLNSIL